MVEESMCVRLLSSARGCEAAAGTLKHGPTRPVGLWDGGASAVPQGPCIGFEEATCRGADGPSAKVRVAEQEWRRRGYKA